MAYFMEGIVAGPGFFPRFTRRRLTLTQRQGVPSHRGTVPQVPAGGLAVAFAPLKVGELAKRTGLTVRTLHHYDEIGLLRPSLHTAAGYRLYAAADVARLQQVVSLRQLGFSLDEIRDCLDRSGFSPLEVVRLHAARLREQIECQRKLCERLDALAEHFHTAGEVSADEFLTTIEAMTMIEQYYTPEQLDSLKKRSEDAAALGRNLAQEGAAAWADLYAQLRAEMEKGNDPADPRVQALEQRRQELIRAFTGGDASIEQSLKKLWTEQGDKLAAQYGYDPKLMEYADKVRAAAEAK
jgi:DNA-binding transcriptional MerR regulator